MTDSIKRRREERLRQLKEQMKQKDNEQGDYPEFSERVNPSYESSYTTYLPPSWEESFPNTETRQPSSAGSKFLFKTISSLFLLSAVYLTYHANLPFSTNTKRFVQEVLTREFNFDGVTAVFQKYAGEYPSIIPTFSKQMKGDKPVWNDVTKHQMLAPVSGKIVEPFAKDGKGIKIVAQAGDGVKAMDQGWVIFIGQKEGLGQTVVIQHADSTQSTYANLDHIQVAEQDWVEAGQIIGTTKGDQPLYFSLQKDHHYVDPMSVISFD
jgi:stage IV sporulation protein FA